MTFSGTAPGVAHQDRGTDRSHVPGTIAGNLHASASRALPSAGLDDVYASAPQPEPAKDPTVAVTLRLMAEPDPTLITRVGALLANIGVVPAKLSFLLLTENLAMITIELRGMGEYGIDLLQRKLASLPQCIHAED